MLDVGTGAASFETPRKSAAPQDEVWQLSNAVLNPHGEERALARVSNHGALMQIDALANP
jgi:hypothetical protein